MQRADADSKMERHLTRISDDRVDVSLRERQSTELPGKLGLEVIGVYYRPLGGVARRCRLVWHGHVWNAGMVSTGKDGEWYCER